MFQVSDFRLHDVIIASYFLVYYRWHIIASWTWDT
ncbi:hypothetical protein RDI58_016237 [Solanum bulbocastanum]|uniref:Uncharacterized protein n=1 Tax=Solanum bulbocastanum TaxID=147425 RepID=A0AAN8TM04_SOLBU